MNKKILIGSIISIFILVGVSLTSVVGYNSIDSGVKESPLFTIRSSRAVEEERNDITCNYISKDEDINLEIPKRDDESESVGVLINLIKKMDDSTLRRLSSLIIYHLHHKNELQEYDSEAIFQSLIQLRNSPKGSLQLKREDSKVLSYPPCTYIITSCSPEWLCLMAILFLCLYGFLFAIAVNVYVFVTSLFNCDPNLP
jgi:hypothetical protein